MSNTWFRMYSEVLNDPKVQKLPGDLFKIWVNTLCVACDNNGTLPNLEDVSFALRMPLHETKTAFHELEKVGLIVTVGETFQFKSWRKRQYKSDVSTGRVKEHRKRQRNVSETPPEQSRTETDTEQKVSKRRGTRFALISAPQEWIDYCLEQRPDLNPATVFENFRDYWIAEPDGVKLNWDATWQRWVRNEKGKQNASTSNNRKQSPHDTAGRAWAHVAGLASEPGGS